MSMGRRGQSVLEYTALVCIVAAALAAMAVYVKRGVSGRLREVSDDLGGQYHPRLTSSNITYNVNSTTVITSRLIPDVVVDSFGTRANVMETTSATNDSTNRTGNESIGAMPASVWQ